MVRFAGDLDGDGYDDVLVTASSSSQPIAGRAYLVNGPVSGTVSLADADARWEGEADDDDIGRAIAGGVDLTGDGQLDVAVTIPAADNGSTTVGAVYVVEGPEPASGTLRSVATASLYDLSGSGQTGSALAAADLDGDGVGDLVLGSPYWRDDSGSTLGGAVFLAGPFDGNATYTEGDGELIAPSYGSEAGAHGLAIAGDEDGDGLPDLLLSAPYESGDLSANGAAWLVLSPPLGTIPLDLLAQARIEGPDDNAALGFYNSSVDGAGDLDADGLSDVIVGASGADVAGSNSGAAYVFHAPLGGTLGPDDASAVILGPGATSGAGRGVAQAGDVNGDLLPDLWVSAISVDSDAGAVYLVPGS